MRQTLGSTLCHLSLASISARFNRVALVTSLLRDRGVDGEIFSMLDLAAYFAIGSAGFNFE